VERRVGFATPVDGDQTKLFDLGKATGLRTPHASHEAQAALQGTGVTKE